MPRREPASTPVEWGRAWAGRRPLWRSLTFVLVGALLVAACGGTPPSPEDVDSVPGQPGTPSPQPAATQATGDQGPPATPLPGARTVNVGHTVWNYGFEMEVLEATLGAPEQVMFSDTLAVLGEYFRLLEVDLRLTNHGAEESEFDGLVAALIDIADASNVMRGAKFTTLGIRGPGDTRLRVPAGGSAEAQLRFELPEDYDLDRGFLVFGGFHENQAIVPLGTGGPELVDLAPYAADVTGELSLQLVDLSLTQVRVTADIPGSNRSIGQGERSLYVYFDFTHRLDRARSLGSSSFELTLPSGENVGRPRGSSDMRDLAPDSVHSLILRFQLPTDEIVGDYTLHFDIGPRAGVGFRGSEDAESEYTLTFTLTP